MIYCDPDDPEAGYFGDDEVYTADPRFGTFTLGDNDDLDRFVIPADCSICGAAIPDDATVPLCTRCEATARAAGKQAADAARYPDPDQPTGR